MKMKKSDLIEKIATFLSASTGYLTAQQLADSCKTSVYRIYSTIRAMRQGFNNKAPVGIHAVKKGYVLSEYAAKEDDVELFRRLNGSRASIYTIAASSAPHIQKRWNTIEDKKAFEIIMRPFTAGGSSILNQGLKIIMDKSKKGT
jgi:hypothetical protein